VPSAATVNVVFSADGYLSKTVPVVLSKGVTQEANATLEKSINFPGTLTGTVSAGGGAPIENARVTTSGPVSLTDETGITGNYLFDAMPSGVFEVSASAEGFATIDKPANISTDGSVAVLNFDLPELDATDINDDGEVNAVDVQLVINGALGLPVSFPTDVNADDTTNAVDVQLVINTALGIS